MAVMARYSWNRGDMLKPARPVPKLAGLKCVGVDRYHVKGLPAREQSTYWELAEQFRGGDVYAFSWDAKRGAWDVWRTEADWLATERNGSIARPDLAELGHGPTQHVTTAPAPKPRAARAKRCNTPPPATPSGDGPSLELVAARLQALVDDYVIPRSVLRVLDV